MHVFSTSSIPGGVAVSPPWFEKARVFVAMALRRPRRCPQRLGTPLPDEYILFPRIRRVEEGIHNPTNDEDDAFIHDDEDLTWTLVSEAAGAEEPSYGTRGAKTPHSAKNNKGKGIATSSTQSKRYGTSAPHLELVDEDDDVEEELGKEDGSFWKDLELEYEESGSESE
ncbi:hypothetical protein Bca101_097016 [Brassica carinata]